MNKKPAYRVGEEPRMTAQQIKDMYNLPARTEEYIDRIEEENDEKIDPGQLEFLVIPGKYLRAKDLNWIEKVLMAYVSLADQEKHCFVKDRKFAEWLGVSHGTVRNMMTILKKKGYVEQVYYNPVNHRRVIKCAK